MGYKEKYRIWFLGWYQIIQATSVQGKDSYSTVDTCLLATLSSVFDSQGL